MRHPRQRPHVRFQMKAAVYPQAPDARVSRASPKEAAHAMLKPGSTQGSMQSRHQEPGNGPMAPEMSKSTARRSKMRGSLPTLGHFTDAEIKRPLLSGGFPTVQSAGTQKIRLGSKKTAAPQSESEEESVSRYFLRLLATVSPKRPSSRITVTPAFSKAAILSSPRPWEPLMMAPAWPMRLPLGAVRPAMKPKTGLG